MKILLAYRANPGYNDSQKNILPNGLYYMATILKDNGYDVYLKNYSEYSDADIEKEIMEINPGIVGLTCYTFNAFTTYTLCDLIKKINKNITIILGGPHATIMSDEILKRISSVDIIVKSEGERTFLELASIIKKGEDIGDVKGIACRIEDKIKHNITRELNLDLDSLPIPAKYYKYQRIITSRGCPGSCIFCSTPLFWGRNVRFRSPEKVVNEIELLQKNYGLSFFIFSDDTFTFDKERTIDICKLILDRGLKITWDCRSRVNFICEEQLKWMKKAGCLSISYGVESGSQKILNTLKKYINLNQIFRASEITKKEGLQLGFFLIVGSPGENEESVNETIELLKKTKPHNILVSIMNLTPDTEICQKQNISIDKWFNNIIEPVYYTSELDFKKLEGYAKKIYVEFSKNRGKYKMDELVEIIKNNPSSSFQAFNHLGVIYLSKNMLKDALICFLKAIKLNPGYAQAYNNLGVVLIRSGDKNKALESFKKAVEKNPEDVSALNNLSKTKDNKV